MEYTTISSVRYFSILQVIFFVIPIIYLIKDNKNNFSSYQVIDSTMLNPSLWQQTKDVLKINLDFKPEVLVYMLWGILGLTLFEVGGSTIIEALIPSGLVEGYNSLMKNFFEAQTELVSNHSKTISEFLQICFFIAILPAICEEILFRGYLMQNIMKRNSKTYAIVISALIFSLIHFNPIGLLPIFVSGLYLGALFYATKSIVIPMTIHFLSNFLVIISVNYGDPNFQLNNIWIAILLFVLGSFVLILTYKKIIKISQVNTSCIY
ncbi:hypothetical protein SDC9_111592 [bioreactor metagenome]|uniref:CAAX prenyl protease 2/Lysostaphin resistance protein A-like domain-containing protein n=1 Tax=bioreactor metagenome TaxID=1076179 RepID=A0A645BSE2_9ZZZZ